jgi:hypothetical protein
LPKFFVTVRERAVLPELAILIQLEELALLGLEVVVRDVEHLHLLFHGKLLQL